MNSTFSTSAVEQLYKGKVFAQRLIMPISYSVNYTVKQLQMCAFELIHHDFFSGNAVNFVLIISNLTPSNSLCETNV